MGDVSSRRGTEVPDGRGFWWGFAFLSRTGHTRINSDPSIDDVVKSWTVLSSNGEVHEETRVDNNFFSIPNELSCPVVVRANDRGGRMVIDLKHFNMMTCRSQDTLCGISTEADLEFPSYLS